MLLTPRKGGGGGGGEGVAARPAYVSCPLTAAEAAAAADEPGRVDAGIGGGGGEGDRRGYEASVITRSACTTGSPAPHPAAPAAMSNECASARREAGRDSPPLLLLPLLLLPLTPGYASPDEAPEEIGTRRLTCRDPLLFPLAPAPLAAAVADATETAIASADWARRTRRARATSSSITLASTCPKATAETWRAACGSCGDRRRMTRRAKERSRTDAKEERETSSSHSHRRGSKQGATRQADAAGAVMGEDDDVDVGVEEEREGSAARTAAAIAARPLLGR